MSIKTFIMGIDGMDYALTQKFLSEGKLKNIENLIKTGNFLPLLSSNPPQSPVAWASMATGKDAGEHGIFDFIKIDRKRYLPLLSIVDLRASIFSLLPQFKRTIKAETIWETLSSKGYKSKVLRWPCTFPAQKINGEILTGMGTPDVKGGLGAYTYYTTREVITNNKRGEVIRIKVINKKINSVVKGPKLLGVRGKMQIQIPFEVFLEKEKARIVINNKEIPLEIGKWSNWIDFPFPIKGNIISYGIGKFLLLSVKPDFQLYLSPLNISPLNEIFPISYPSKYRKTLYEEFGFYATLGLAEDTNALNDGIINEHMFLEMCDFLLDEKLNIFYKEINSNVTFFSFVFDTLDRIQHMFWRYIDPSYSHHNVTEQDLQFQNTIEHYYEKFDNIIGKLLSNIAKDTLLIIVSDHGFGPLRKTVDLNAYLREKGYVSIQKGKISPPLFKKFNFQKTRAYACGFTGININKKGREGKGIVDEQQFANVKEEVKKALLEFTDEKTGERVIKKVYDSDKIYSKKYRHDAPDLVIGFAKGYRSGDSSVIGGIDENPIKDNTKKWSGDHIFDPKEVPGIFITSHPLGLQDVSVFDIKDIVEQSIKT